MLFNSYESELFPTELLSDNLDDESILVVQPEKENEEDALIIQPFQGFNGKIIEDDADVHIDAYLPDEEEENNWNKILSYRYRGTILERPIISVELPAKEDDPLKIIVMVEGFPVLIESEEFFSQDFFHDTHESVTRKRDLERERQAATRMIGARIPFMIIEAYQTTVDGQLEYQIKGSRQIALEKKREYYFFSEDRTPPEIGTQVKARVLTSTYSTVTVETLGVEVDVPASELSSCRWIQPREECPPGSVLYFLIKKSDIQTTQKTVSLELTRKPLDAKQMRKNLRYCSVGARYGATIVGINDRVYLASLDGIDVRAVIPRVWYYGPRLTYGDKVSFQIVSAELERGYVRGNCIYLAQKSH